MFRTLVFCILLLISAIPGASYAQDGGGKPTEILPNKDEIFSRLPFNSTLTGPDDITTPDVPLVLTPAKSLDDGTFVIGAVQIEGLNNLSQADFSIAIEPFVGRSAEPLTLQELARAVANKARSAGFLLSSAVIPAQSVSLGVVRIRLDEGIVHKVSLNGTENRFVLRLFHRLIGKPGMRKDIEQAILLTEGLHGFSVVKTSFVRTEGKGILTVQVSEKAHELYATIDNYGRQSSGPRASLVIDLNGVFDETDLIHSQVLTSPADPKQLLFVSTRYSNILTENGNTLSAFGGAGRTLQVNDDRTWSKSKSRFGGIMFSAPALRTHAASVWINLEGSYLSVDRSYSDARPRRDRVTTLIASATGAGRFAGGRISGGVAATQGLDVLGATRPNDPNASRRDASGQFTKGEMWLNWNRKLGHGFSLRTVVNAQVASRPVLSSQEIDLGGPRIGRGFNYSEKSGDQGVRGLAELRKYFDQPAKGISSMQIYTFVDGGYLHNLRAISSGSSLVSAGGGIRTGIGKIDLVLELAIPVKGMRDNSKSPHLNFALGFAF